MIYSEYQAKYHYRDGYRENPTRCCNFVCEHCIRVPLEPSTEVQLELFRGDDL